MIQLPYCRCVRACAASALLAIPLDAQTLPVDDPVLRRIWRLGTDSSQVWTLAQALTDSIGPRLTGSPGQQAGNRWLIERYTAWGIPARQERYGTWLGWRRGVTHIDLLQPRVRTLEGTMLAWSPGTRGAVTGPAIALPEVATSDERQRWLRQVRGRFVLTSMAQPTCRPDDDWRQWADSASFARMRAERSAAQQRWRERVRRAAGVTDTVDAAATRALYASLDSAGALGIVTGNWSAGWGVEKVFSIRTNRTPGVVLSCEDYGLVYRLASGGQGPVLRLDAEAQASGEVPVFNVIAEIKGRDKPEEYVMMSAHFDSWDASSGATDNATGTVTMLEAMRILRQVYPSPRRTILVGHWSGEEQGLNGSRAFAQDHPEVVRGLHALFNQDNGTGRVVSISSSGFVDAGANYARWLARLPSEISRHFTSVSFPGVPAAGGSDHASFVCHGAPGFSLGALSWNYGTYTWHTNRDTFDKIVIDDLRNNATLTAMLVYLASEDAQPVGRARRVPAPSSSGAPGEWPPCREARRTSDGYGR